MHTIILIYGCHGSGKTHVSKEISRKLNAKYICTDYAENPDYIAKAVHNIQRKYFETIKHYYDNILKGKYSSYSKILVVDYGFYQMIPYIKYFSKNDKELVDLIPVIEEYETKIEQEFEIKRILVDASLEKIKQRILLRSLNRNVEFELKSLPQIYAEFKSLSKEKNMLIHKND